MGDNWVPWGCLVQGDEGWSSPCREGFAGGTPCLPDSALINQQASELQCMPATISLTEIPELFAARRDASAARTAKRAARRAAALLPYGFLCASPCSATIPTISVPSALTHVQEQLRTTSEWGCSDCQHCPSGQPFPQPHPPSH